MSLKSNIEKRGLKDILNPKKWLIYMLSHVRSWLSGDPKEQVSRAEQLIYRMDKCSECLESGSCIVCGCKSPDNMIEPKNWCEGGRWDEMMSPDEWEKFKSESRLGIGIKYD